MTGGSQQFPQYTPIPNSGDSGGDFVFFPKQHPLPPLHEKWALVVGISRFADKKIPLLRYSTKDAGDFTAALKDPQIGHFREDHVFLLVDEQASLANIRSALNGVGRRVGRGDLVVLYFASHVTPREMDNAGVNYFVAHDTRIDVQDDLPATALPLVEIYDFARDRVKSERVLLLIDGSHATLPNYELPNGSGRVIISACDSLEASYESNKLQNGYFTYYVLDALRSSHGMMSPVALYNSVREKVSSQVMQDLHARQTPVMLSGGNDTSIVLGQVEPQNSIVTH